MALVCAQNDCLRSDERLLGKQPVDPQTRALGYGSDITQTPREAWCPESSNKKSSTSADASQQARLRLTSQQKVKGLALHPPPPPRTVFNEQGSGWWTRIIQDLFTRQRHFSLGKTRWKLRGKVRDRSACLNFKSLRWKKEALQREDGGEGKSSSLLGGKSSTTLSPLDIFWNVTRQSLQHNLDWFSLKWRGSSFMSFKVKFFHS